MNIAIVGAGIAGTMVGYYLNRAGHRVTLFDQRAAADHNIATYTAAGMLAPYAELESALHTLYELGIAGLQEWSVLAAELSADIGYVCNGTLMLAHATDHAEFTRISQILERTGLTTSQQMQPQDDIAELEPELAERFTRGLYFPLEGRVDVVKTLHALQSRLQSAGCQCHYGTPVKVISPGCLVLEDGTQRFDWVLDCRGLAARDNLTKLRGVRGELLVVEAPEVRIARMIRLLHPRYRLYISPQQDHRYIVGASQLETDDMSPISVRSTLELLSAAVSVHAGFAEARIIETRVNCRPTLPDNEPRIYHQPGLLRLNGLYRHGYLLSPLLAREASRLIAEPEQYRSDFADLIETQLEVA